MNVGGFSIFEDASETRQYKRPYVPEIVVSVKIPAR